MRRLNLHVTRSELRDGRPGCRTCPVHIRLYRELRRRLTCKFDLEVYWNKFVVRIYHSASVVRTYTRRLTKELTKWIGRYDKQPEKAKPRRFSLFIHDSLLLW